MRPVCVPCGVVRCGRLKQSAKDLTWIAEYFCSLSLAQQVQYE